MAAVPDAITVAASNLPTKFQGTSAGEDYAKQQPAAVAPLRSSSPEGSAASAEDTPDSWCPHTCSSEPQGQHFCSSSCQPQVSFYLYDRVCYHRCTECTQYACDDNIPFRTDERSRLEIHTRVLLLYVTPLAVLIGFAPGSWQLDTSL